MSSDSGDDRARVESYKWWQWVLGFLFLPVLILMVIGVSSRRLRPKLTAARIWAFSILGTFAFFICVGIIGTLAEPETRSAGPPPQNFGKSATYSPSSTPILISAPKATPQPISIPISTFTPIPAPSGLGIPPGNVISQFKALGFSFESSPLKDGTPRYMGRIPNRGAILDVGGYPSDLKYVTLIVGITTPDGTSYMKTLMTSTLPDWPEGKRWPAENLVAAMDGDIRRTKHGDAFIKLETLMPLTEGLMLTISSEEK